MANLRPAGIPALTLALAAFGCFGDPPRTGSGTDDSAEAGSGTTTGTETSSTGEPETTLGTLEGSGESSGDPPCDPETSECVGPGETMWTIELGDAGNDGTYTVVVDGQRVVVGGELASGGGSVPWMVELDLADGTERWSEAGEVGEGLSVVRGLATVGDGVVAGVGSVEGMPTSGAGWLDVRDSMGAQIAAHRYTNATNSFLIGAAVTGGHLWAAGFASDTGDPAQGYPLLLSYQPQGENAWALDFDSLLTGQLSMFEGALFDVAFTPTGDLIAVGYVLNDGQDAVIMQFTAGGDYVDTPVTIGGEYDDGFVGVEIDSDGSGVAVGRDEKGQAISDVLIVPFQFGDSLVAGAARTWSDTPFASANEFARDGDALFIAVGTSHDPELLGPGFDSEIVRFDGDAAEPTWVVPFAADSPGRDYAADVALAPDDTIVVCGVFTPEGTGNGDGWVRRLKR